MRKNTIEITIYSTEIECFKLSSTMYYMTILMFMSALMTEFTFIYVKNAFKIKTKPCPKWNWWQTRIRRIHPFG